MKLSENQIELISILKENTINKNIKWEKDRYLGSSGMDFNSSKYKGFSYHLQKSSSKDESKESKERYSLWIYQSFLLRSELFSTIGYSELLGELASVVRGIHENEVKLEIEDSENRKNKKIQFLIKKLKEK
jgi:hypothetical protein